MNERIAKTVILDVETVEKNSFPIHFMLSPEVNSGKHPVFSALKPSIDSSQDEEKWNYSTALPGYPLNSEKCHSEGAERLKNL